MAYFLGKDVDVYWTTEQFYTSVSGTYAAASTGTALSAEMDANMNADIGACFVRSRSHGIATTTQLSDITGVDFTPGATNEDISFMGKKTSLTAEVKKEYVVTLTRKISANCFDQLYNTPARNGVYATSGADTGGNVTIHDGLTTSKNQNFGYRLHLKIKGDTEVVTIRNCCITSYTKTLDPNNAQEETIEFYSYVQPVVSLSSTAVSCTGATAATEI